MKSGRAKRGSPSARSLFAFFILTVLPVTAFAVTTTSEIGANLFTSTVSFPAERRAYVVAHMTVPADVESVWSVLTDYDNLADYMPHLEKSEVLHRQSDRVTLRQEGSLWFPMKKLKSTATMEVLETPPQEIAFRATEGDYAVYEGHWRLQARPEGTDLIYEAVIEPKFWVPQCLLGALEKKIRKGTFEAVLEQSSQPKKLRFAERR
jgi:ribosome-associated toxin RatA of RatAB toxin-antitoxin module